MPSVVERGDAALAMTSFWAIFSREIRRFLRIWVQTLVPPAVTMLLYFAIFGTLIGERVGLMGGIPYVQYIAPGLVMMAIITNTYANVVGSFFSAKFQRYIEELLVSPTPNWVILSGYVGGGIARGLMVGVIVTGVAHLFTKLPIHHLGITLLTAFLTALLFACAGLINALFSRSFDDTSIVPTFLLTPLTYFGGVFYSIELLPEPWRSLSYLNPILYMVNAFRYGMLGHSDIPVGLALVFIAALAIALFLVAWGLLHRGVGLRQ